MNIELRPGFMRDSFLFDEVLKKIIANPKQLVNLDDWLFVVVNTMKDMKKQVTAWMK